MRTFRTQNQSEPTDIQMTHLNFASVVAPFGVESGRRIEAEEFEVLNIMKRVKG